MSFITGTQTELLFSLATPVTKANYTSQAVIGPLAASAPVPKIQGGYFSENPNPLGRCLYLQAFGTISNAATGSTFSPAIALDTAAGTALNPITIYAATAPTASVVAQWNMQAWITCTAFGESAGMTLQVNGTWGQASVATGGVANAGALGANFGGSLTGLTPATTYFVELFGTWSGATTVSTVIQQMTFWGLN